MKHVLELYIARRRLGDVAGEARASGNLGNTLKQMGRFEEAISCCLLHLKIARELNDLVRCTVQTKQIETKRNEMK